MLTKKQMTMNQLRSQNRYLKKKIPFLKKKLESSNGRLSRLLNKLEDPLDEFIEGKLILKS